MTTRVGFIGLGNMGKHMAINIAKAGFDLMVYDLRAEPMRELTALGAKAARSASSSWTTGKSKPRSSARVVHSALPNEAVSSSFTAPFIPVRCASSPSRLRPRA